MGVFKPQKFQKPAIQLRLAKPAFGLPSVGLPSLNSGGCKVQSELITNYKQLARHHTSSSLHSMFSFLFGRFSIIGSYIAHVLGAWATPAEHQFNVVPTSKV